VECIEHGVLYRDGPEVKRFMSELHGLGNVAVVLPTPEVASTGGCLRMRSLDFDAPHFSIFGPLTLDFRVVQQIIKGEKAEIHQIIKLPRLHPHWLPFQMEFGNRNIPVMVDHQLTVSGDANIKLDAVKVLNAVAKTRKRVFWRLVPAVFSLHDAPKFRAFSRFASRCGLQKWADAKHFGPNA